MEEKIKLIAITGPTASGKSALAAELALILDGEVVSCDSMQIYRGMNIGTAKPAKEEMRGVPHHMIDVADPYIDGDYNCARYSEEAGRVIADIASRGKLPVICGGTGMYLDSLLSGTAFGDAPADADVRKKLWETDPEILYEELCSVDPDSAAAIHRNNVKRVIRALEIYRISGITKTEWDARSRVGGSPYDFKAIALGMLDRRILFRRIDERVDKMINDGLCDEVRSLNLVPGTTAAAAIGYKEMEAYLRGEMSLSDAADQIKLATRHYAKRQESWLRRRDYIKWVISCGENVSFEKVVNISLTLLGYR